MPKTPAFHSYAKPARAYLKEWREHCGLSQEALGELMNGTSKGRVSLKESRKEGWDDAYLGAVAKALGVEPVNLLVPPADSIRAAIRRIPGLKDERHFEILEGTVADLLQPTSGARGRTGGDDRPSTATPRRVPGPSRSRA